MNITAIILSGGSGKRMGGAVAKQYMDLQGKPVLYYSIKAFEESVVNDIIIVTAAGDEQMVMENIVKANGFKKVRACVAGGAERADSVLAGLRACGGDKASSEMSGTVSMPADPLAGDAAPELNEFEERRRRVAESAPDVETKTVADTDRFVLIHDGARPFIKSQVINNIAAEAMKTGAAMAAVQSKDTVKLAQYGAVAETTERPDTYLAQTPQAFRLDMIRNAYERVVERYFSGAGTSAAPAPGTATGGNFDDFIKNLQQAVATSQANKEREKKMATLTDDAAIFAEIYPNIKITLVDGGYDNLKLTTQEDLDYANWKLGRK